MDANHFALEGSKANGFALWVYVAEVCIRVTFTETALTNSRQNDHKWGDQWNGEDLSIYSPDDLKSPIPTSSHSTRSDSTVFSKDHLINVEEEKPSCLKVLKPPCTSSDFSQATMQPQRSHRAVEAFLRPTPIYTNGRLESHTFDLKKCTFTMRLIANQATPETPSEIYLPEFHFSMENTTVEVSGGKWEICHREFHTVSLQYLRWWHGEGIVDIEIRRTKCNRTSQEYAALQKLHKSRCMMM